MKYTYYTVNEIGLGEIHQFLGAHHKRGCDHFGKNELFAWAAQVDYELSKGNAAIIEIRAWDSVSGRNETHTISDAGLDEVVVDN